MLTKASLFVVFFAGAAAVSACSSNGGGPVGGTGGVLPSTGGQAGAASGGISAGAVGGAAGNVTGGSGGSAGTTAVGGTAGSGGSTAGVGGSAVGGMVNAGTGGTGGAGADAGGTAGLGGAGTGGDAGSGGAAGAAGASGAAGALNCPPATTLKGAADCTQRLIGAALAASHLGENGYATAAREHNFVTPENEMKWDQIEPTRGNFNYGPADQIVNFAMQNGMKVKGHTLVWHKQLPDWVANLTSASELRTVMLSHITNVVNHFKGKVVAWDVVNEAWITDGRTGDGNPMLRDSVFSRVLGPSFIDEAFTAARAADRDVLLIYNEFANEGLSDKSNSVYEMVRDMKTRGIPIDGVGLQMHYGFNTNPTPADVATNMQRLADLGLKIFVSEMDVNGCAGYTVDQEKTQYHDMVAACVAQPACSGFTIWGVTDQYSWLNDVDTAGCAANQPPLPLLWDDSYGKKPAYTGVMDALLGH